MKQQAQAYLRGENLLNLKTGLVFPSKADRTWSFCQISQNLYDYYRNFQVYYRTESTKSATKLYPPVFLSALFLEKYGKIERMEEIYGITTNEINEKIHGIYQRSLKQTKNGKKN